MQHLSAVLPPALLIVGERDFPMLEGDVRAFAHKAQGMGRKIDVASAPAKDHMAVTRGMTDAHDPVFKRVLEFLEAVAAAKN